MKNFLLHIQKAEQMRDSYNRSAVHYDSRYKYIQYLKYGITLQKIIIPEKQQSISIRGPLLDLGGGTGLFSVFLQEFSELLKSYESDDPEINLLLQFTLHLIRSNNKEEPTRLVIPSTIICDISFEMLQQVIKKPNIYGLVACDGSHLPFRDSQFLTITAFTVLQNIVQKDLAIAEAFRTLKEDGSFAISNLEKSQDKQQIIESLGNYFKQILPIYFRELLEEFQKIIVQSDKYSQFHDLAKVEDFFITAKKISRNEK